MFHSTAVHEDTHVNTLMSEPMLLLVYVHLSC